MPSSTWNEIPAAQVDTLYASAENALQAFETALSGAEDWLSGSDQPSLLDAALFSYLHLILDDELGSPVGGAWSHDRLREMIRGFPNLRRHAERIHSSYFDRAA